jgi:hypothetical protein
MNKKLITLSEHNSINRLTYNLDSSPQPNGIACPDCGEELLDSNPMETLASNPPQKNTKCSSCDYTGYRIC